MRDGRVEYCRPFHFVGNEYDAYWVLKGHITHCFYCITLERISTNQFVACELKLRVW